MVLMKEIYSSAKSSGVTCIYFYTMILIFNANNRKRKLFSILFLTDELIEITSLSI